MQLFILFSLYHFNYNYLLKITVRSSYAFAENKGNRREKKCNTFSLNNNSVFRQWILICVSSVCYFVSLLQFFDVIFIDLRSRFSCVDISWKYLGVRIHTYSIHCELLTGIQLNERYLYFWSKTYTRNSLSFFLLKREITTATKKEKKEKEIKEIYIQSGRN